MKEDNFIKIIKEELVLSAKYIGDDTAYIPEKGLILTQDTLIEDVHFRQSTISPYNLGIKSVAVNLSDIAASGGVAKFLLISISIPEKTDESFIKEFYHGVNYICQEYNVLVVGGDLTKSDKIAITVTAIGYDEGLCPARRSFALPDDVVIVTGAFGSSRAGLWILEEKYKNNLSFDIPKRLQDKFVKAHINPIPKLNIGRKILETSNKDTAMMDTSDGLADALYKISLQSNISMQIDYNLIPTDNDLVFIANLANKDTFNWVLYGGEDYELIATVSKECFKTLIDNNIPVTQIGRVVKANGKPSVIVKYKDKDVLIDANSFEAEMFNHFK